MASGLMTYCEVRTTQNLDYRVSDLDSDSTRMGLDSSAPCQGEWTRLYELSSGRDGKDTELAKLRSMK